MTIHYSYLESVLQESFVKMLLKELIGLTILLTSIINCSSESIDFDNELELKRERLFLNPPTSCTITKSGSHLYYSCSSDESPDIIKFKIEIDKNDWIYVKCIYISSFTIFPDFTKYNNSTGIDLRNCKMPTNETLHHLTSKISKKLKYLTYQYERQKDSEENKLDKYFFEGLSQLESLNLIATSSKSILLSFNFSELLVNLTKITMIKI